MNQGTITVDWNGKGGMLITYPDGKMQTVANKAAAQYNIKRWCQEQTDIVARITGGAIGNTRIEWHNHTNK